MNMTLLIKHDDKLIKGAIYSIRRPLNIDYDDMYQEAVISYMNIVAVKNWFKEDKTNYEINYIKKGIKRHLIDYLNSQNSFIDHVDDSISRVDVQSFFIYLTPIQQFIIENRFIYNNFGYKKIGRLLNCSNSKVMSVCNSALVQLSKKITL